MQREPKPSGRSEDLHPDKEFPEIMTLPNSHSRYAGDTSNWDDQPFRVVVDEIQDGATNLAVDELLLKRVSKASASTETYLRFYSWTRPTLSLGLAQQASRVVRFRLLPTARNSNRSSGNRG